MRVMNAGRTAHVSTARRLNPAAHRAAPAGHRSPLIAHGSSTNPASASTVPVVIDVESTTVDEPSAASSIEGSPVMSSVEDTPVVETSSKAAPHHSTVPVLPLGTVPTKDSKVDRPFFPTISPQQLFDDMFGEPKMPEFLAGLEAINTTGGPVMYRPQVTRAPGSPDPSTLPILLYLPGIDGTGLAAYRQFPALSKVFDLCALYVPPSDRSSFQEIVTAAQEQLEAELAGGDPLRPVYLLGESFGGLVALALAQQTQAVDRIILCNPATSFSDSMWPMAGPLLTSLPREIYNSLPIALSPILTNPINVALNSMPAPAIPGLPPSPLDVASSAAWGLVGLLPELGALRSVLPPETLSHRLGLLKAGSQQVNASLGKVEQRVLLLVGENDMVIPSATEGPRLKRALPRCTLKLLKGRSHAMLQEAGLDLVKQLEDEGFYRATRVLSSPAMPPSKAGGAPRSGTAFGKPLPLEILTAKEIQKAMDDGGLSGLKRLVSPVFFSTEPGTGRVVQGLQHVPVGTQGKPVLFVGNHQLFAPDMPLMIAAFLQERGVMVRGLAHPFALAGMQGAAKEPEAEPQVNPLAFPLSFTQPGGPSARSNSNPFGDFLKTFGAVTVSGTNMHKLLSRGETVLLYPGGVREAYKLRDEKYELIWPTDRSEFIRMAAKFGATIVPFGAVGAEDGVNQVLDGRELQALPVVGDWLRSQQSNIPMARKGVNASEEVTESFVAPLVTFNPPSRFYFYFGEPLELRPDMVNDREACDEQYRVVKARCRQTLDYLLDRRETDPYKDLLRRLAFEASWGGTKQAPTFTP